MSYIKGIDVSNNNGEIDFSKATEYGVQYVYMKATQGATYQDNYMYTFYNNCKANNLKIGAYHCLTSTSSPEKQAGNFSNRIKNLNWDLVPMLYIEVEFSALSDYVIRFINEFQKLTNLEIGIYTYAKFISNLKSISNEIRNMKFWCADYNKNQLVLQKTFFTNVVGHQYSNNGNLKGINWYVNLDAFKEDVLLNKLSGKWVKDINGWIYEFNNDTEPKKKWLQIDGVWYYFKKDGYMATGWLELDDEWHYFYEDGTIATEWVTLDKDCFYFNKEGVMQTGWLEKDKFWYYFNLDGYMAREWLKLNNKWYYFYDSGKMAIGWLKLNDKWYYFNSKGIMIACAVNIDGDFYYYKYDEIMANE